jgi:hypothetical protein
LHPPDGLLQAAMSSTKGRSMRPIILMTAFLSVAAAGCTARDGKAGSTSHSGGGVAASLDKVKVETKEAAQAMRDYAYAEKAEFVSNMKKELVATQEELSRLGAKVDAASDSAKADARVKLAAVRAKWVQAKAQLDRAESATESTWDDVKLGFKQSYVDLKDSFNTLRQWLSDKIAP